MKITNRWTGAVILEASDQIRPLVLIAMVRPHFKVPGIGLLCEGGQGKTQERKYDK